jgi:hypothetical protein
MAEWDSSESQALLIAAFAGSEGGGYGFMKESSPATDNPAAIRSFLSYKMQLQIIRNKVSLRTQLIAGS